ncbi:MAG: LysM peptidoglycan-binding domain-containing protein [Chitinophagales bacterium]
MKQILFSIILTCSTLFLSAQNQQTHTVSKGETLYRISVKYDTTVDDLKAANPRIVGYDLSIGDKLVIPSATNNAKGFTSSGGGVDLMTDKVDTKAADDAIKAVGDSKEVVTTNDNPLIGSQKELIPMKDNNASATIAAKTTARVLDRIKPVNHLVKNGETLFSIAKLYGESLNALKNWNNLPTLVVQEGQTIVVGWIAPEGINVTEAGNVEGKIETITTSPKKAMSAFERKYVNMGSDKNYRLKQETGIATKFVDGGKSPDGNFYALHKNAPLFSIVKVTNPVNNKSIYVKIIERIPNNGKEEAIIRLPESAAKALRMLDDRTLVECSYNMSKK